MNEKLIEKIIEKYLLGNLEKNDSEESESVFIGKYIILRCSNAGVHFGKLEYAKNGVYRLSESRRLWKWRIKNKNGVSLSELALLGIDEEYSCICTTIPMIEITEMNGCELIPVNESVIDSFKNIKNYIPNN